MPNNQFSVSEINSFDLQGKNAALMMFVNQIIHSNPNLAASILISIKEISDQQNPVIQKLFVLDYFETPEVASEAISVVLQGFNDELNKLIDLTIQRMEG
ncbi:hypothetical protein F959_01617 [Acinetobacter venetianus RAG-1 = CIP 110063]|uniref:Uncharacterized protein n=1 Tax=Acinetobacter venetianus (strain ATCC 31012 / DSM 23050 / BCRC 14357 / CCUG 45561 / CIP 110063 / KCTC 2702 / LMG 19082 / RAG-1) TaxID=1191460 RepID=N8ZUQ3_ACIVR|nr:hypothetical protein [Acinetobacter venetianus]ENV37494.1 hypothetical protein F959_01617 [Acinetobacter venetianus RAG-1 = CIP 110063]